MPTNEEHEIAKEVGEWIDSRGGFLSDHTGQELVDAFITAGYEDEDAHIWMSWYETEVLTHPGYQPTPEETFMVLACCKGMFEPTVECTVSVVEQDFVKATPAEPVKISALVGDPSSGKRFTTRQIPYYQISCTPVQFRLLSKACEVIARLDMGQWGEVVDMVDWGDMDPAEIGSIRMTLDAMGRRALNQRGISACGDTAKRAWDMHCSIRYQDAWDRDDGDISMRGVYHDEPDYLGDEPEIRTKMMTITDVFDDQTDLLERCQHALRKIVEIQRNQYNQDLGDPEIAEDTEVVKLARGAIVYRKDELPSDMNDNPDPDA